MEKLESIHKISGDILNTKNDIKHWEYQFEQLSKDENIKLDAKLTFSISGPRGSSILHLEKDEVIKILERRLVAAKLKLHGLEKIYKEINK